MEEVGVRSKIWPSIGLVVVAGSLAIVPTATGASREKLEMYVLDGPTAKVAEAATGLELRDIRHSRSGTRADAVLTPGQAAKIRAQGVRVNLLRNKKGQSVTEQAELMAAGGFNVWRSWDEPNGIRDELYDVARKNRDLVTLEVLGKTHQGREIIALKVTEKGPSKRPAVLYSSLQHAREWISGEVNRRTLHYFIDKYRAGDASVRAILKSTQLWFVLVANPDGYQYTFDVDRLWRKNARDNNGDGQITVGDGVDPNRNFDEHWGYDDEGSSNEPFSETYRGPGPASEPETKALAGLIALIKPKFQSNLHSYGPWLLYPQGWQTGTLDADNPIYVAMAGTDENVAIPTFNVGLARSARTPADPVSPVGIDVKPFYLDQDEIDPQNGQQSLFDFKFAVSYGDPQEVRVLAKRSLGEVTLNYRVNGGEVQTEPTSEWTGGERYGPGHQDYYHVMRGQVTGT